MNGFFETRLRTADALDKWRTQPIGGEVRPEVWKCLFDEPSCAPRGQELDRCVEVTHVSWLCKEGVFRGQVQGAARERAIRAVQRMGYELHVVRAGIQTAGGHLAVTLTVTNTGGAPFYYDWPVALALLNAAKQRVATWQTNWRLSAVLPARRPRPGASRAQSRRWPPAITLSCCAWPIRCPTDCRSVSPTKPRISTCPAG